jgi:hypothetical protein
MIRPEYRVMLESQHGVLVALWWVFIGAIFFYLWISYAFLTYRQLAITDSFSQAARLFLWILTFLDLATLVWWKRRFLRREAILGGAKKYKLLQALEGHKTPVEERTAAVVSSYVTSKVVAFAMAEAVAIYGFALALMGRYFVGQYILTIASGVLLVMEFPSRRFLTELLSEAENENKK